MSDDFFHALSNNFTVMLFAQLALIIEKSIGRNGFQPLGLNFNDQCLLAHRIGIKHEPNRYGAYIDCSVSAFVFVEILR